MAEFTPKDVSLFDYTLKGSQLEELRRAAEQESRPLIDRNTDVLNGLSGSDYDAESIAVDYNAFPEVYDALVQQVIGEASERSEDGALKVKKDLIFDAVMKMVRERLAYSLEGVAAMYEEAGAQKGVPIALSRYLERGIGVCRHQALLTAALLELLKKKGIVGGSARLNRSRQWTQAGEPGGHAWVRYTNSAGEVWILDVTNNFVGTLEQAKKLEKGWNYLLPEDMVQDAIELGAPVARKLIDSSDIPLIRR